MRDIDRARCRRDWRRISGQFTSMPEVDGVIAEGETKTSCHLVSGINADLRVVSEASFPYALMYFTGNKEHNVRLRGIAKKRGLKLNEYGLFDGDRPIVLPTEAAIYEFLGLAFVPPELREDTGEIEAARERTLPRLIEVGDIKGAFHVHTELSDGTDSLEAIAEVARHMGLSYVGISDHSKSAYYAGGLKAEDVRKQWEAIDRINAEHDDFCFFKGIESDILTDGSLDYDEEILEGFDFVGGLHPLRLHHEQGGYGGTHYQGHGQPLYDHTGASHGQAPPREGRISRGHGAHHRGGSRSPRRHRAECEPLPLRHRLEVSEAGQTEGGPDLHRPGRARGKGPCRAVLRGGHREERLAGST